ncbi:MAG: 50S ribosome-binding GTPase [Pirellulales bacterium]|nr:50S ribosome-binding GTPase [Pirellulales bacterium]
MAANLTPQYLKAQEEYRRAQTTEEEIRCLEIMLKEIPKHKASEKMQADLKSKLSAAKKDLQKEKSGGKKTTGVRIPRQGAGTAVVLGGPNAGKSQLVCSLTRATPEVAEYPFTTRAPQPGMMAWEDVTVQLVDTPPVTADYFESYMHGLVRSADVVLLMLDLGDDDSIEQCQDVINRFSETKTRLAKATGLDENDVGISYTSTILVPNKIDLPDAAERYELFQELCSVDFLVQQVSALRGDGLDELRKRVYETLDVIRVYTKQPTQKEPDMEKPFTIPRGQTILDVAEQIHRDIAANFKTARVWGTQVHDGTTVKADYIPEDKDIVEIHV